MKLLTLIIAFGVGLPLWGILGLLIAPIFIDDEGDDNHGSSV